jgi:hypothetical protein
MAEVFGSFSERGGRQVKLRYLLGKESAGRDLDVWEVSMKRTKGGSFAKT